LKEPVLFVKNPDLYKFKVQRFRGSGFWGSENRGQRSDDRRQMLKAGR
jgi:hypothetical protein